MYKITFESAANAGVVVVYREIALAAFELATFTCVVEGNDNFAIFNMVLLLR